MEELRYSAFTDGGARGGNPGRAAWGWVLYSEGTYADKVEVTRDGEFLLTPKTNNVAEYMAVIDLLEECCVRGLSGVQIHCDSELVVKQLLGKYKVSHPDMFTLWAKASALLDSTKSSIKWIPREQNKVADSIVNEMEDAHERFLGIVKKGTRKK